METARVQSTPKKFGSSEKRVTGLGPVIDKIILTIYGGFSLTAVYPPPHNYLRAQSVFRTIKIQINADQDSSNFESTTVFIRNGERWQQRTIRRPKGHF